MSAIEPLYVDIDGAIALTTLSKSTIEAEVRAAGALVAAIVDR